MRFSKDAGVKERGTEGTTEGRDMMAGDWRPRRFSSVPRAIVACGLALAVALPMAGCAQSAVTSGETSASTATQASATTASGTLDTSDMFSKRDLDGSYDASSATKVTLADGASTVLGSGVSVSGNTVTITAEGTYVLSGSLADGRIVVDADENAKVQVVLAGASVTSSGASAIYVKGADKVFVTSDAGTANALSATGAAQTEDDHNLDGTLFSTSDLTLNGTGSLSVTSAQGSAVVGKDDVVLAQTSATLTGAAHGVQANDSIRVASGSWKVTATTDGLHAANDSDATKGYIYVADGTIEVEAGSDGMDAGYILQVDGGRVSVAAGDDGLHSESDLVIAGGDIAVTRSNEGLEGARVTISGGTQNVVATDDGVNASGDSDANASTAGGAAAGGAGGSAGGAAAGGGGTPPSGGAASGTSGASPTSGTEGGTAPTDAPTPPSGDMGGGMRGGMGGGMGSDSSASLTITGGTLTVDAGGDGLDSNGTIDVSGGTVLVSEPTNSGNAPIDVGDGSKATISGGTVIALGASGMVEGFDSSSSQGSMLVSASGSAGDEVKVLGSDGTVLASFTATKSFSCVIASAPGMVSGGTYTLSVAGQEQQVTLDGTTYSDVAGMGAMGGRGGGMTGGRGAMGGSAGSAAGDSASGSTGGSAGSSEGSLFSA